MISGSASRLPPLSTTVRTCSYRARDAADAAWAAISCRLICARRCETMSRLLLPTLGALLLDVLLERAHRLAQFGQAIGQPFRGVSCAFGLRLELALHVLVDQRVGDQRRLARIGRREADPDQARSLLGLDRETLQKSIEQGGRIPAFVHLQHDERSPVPRAASSGRRRVSDLRPRPMRRRERLGRCPGLQPARRRGASPESPRSRFRHAQPSALRGVLGGRLLGEFGIAVELQVADDPGCQATRLEHRHLGVDLRAIADHVLHLFVDPDDARRAGLDHDQDVRVIVDGSPGRASPWLRPWQAPWSRSASISVGRSCAGCHADRSRR